MTDLDDITAPDATNYKAAYEGASRDRDALLSHLKDIATDMSHEAYHEHEHIYEMSTGGQRFCGPCHAWRILNGTPHLWEPTPKMLQEALNAVEPWLSGKTHKDPELRHIRTLAAAARLKYALEGT